jgi:hypothetical protein
VNEIPDLSKLNGSTPPEPAPAPIPAKTAFLVVVDDQGNIQVSSDLGLDVTVERPCSTDDIYTACALIQMDIQSQRTADLVSKSLLQMGSMLQQQSQNEQLRQRLNLK